MRTSLLLMLSVAVFTAGCTLPTTSNTSDDNSSSIQVGTSFYVIEEFTKHVGGKNITIVSPPGSSGGHSYSPSPQDLASLLASDIFIFQGESFDPWAEKLVADFESQSIPVVEITEHLELLTAAEEDNTDESGAATEDEHGMYDPHTWTSPVQAIDTVKVIRDALISTDPTHAEDYSKNAAEYIAALEALHKQYETGLENCSLDTVVVAHDAFGYMSKQYGFTIEPIAGFSPDAVPSAKHVAALSDRMSEQGIEYILFETLATPDVAETLASDVGAQTLVLNPLEGLTEQDMVAGKDYIQIMEDNLKSLQIALDCQS